MRTNLFTILSLFLVASGVFSQDNPVVVIETNLGNITVELFAARAPISVENFLTYAEEGFYEGTIFHRVQKGVLIQGGGFTPGLQQKKTRDPIENEARNGLKNERGTLAMARGAGVNSATSQFYINTGNNRDFDHKGLSRKEFGYAVFGKVVDGSDVVSTIENIKTTKRNGMRDVPTIPVIIKTVRLVE